MSVTSLQVRYAVRNSSQARTREELQFTACMLSFSRRRARMLGASLPGSSPQPIMLIKSKVIDVAASRTHRMISINLKRHISSSTYAVT